MSNKDEYELVPINVPMDEAESLLDSGRLNEALHAYELLIEENTLNSGVWKGKGTALMALGRYQGALDCFEYNINLDPSDAEAWNNKGDILTFFWNVCRGNKSL